MKRTRKLIITAAIAAVLVLVYFVVNAIVKQNEAGDDTSDDESYAVAEMDAESLTAMSIKQTDSTGEETKISTMEFKLKSDSSGWYWLTDNTVPLSNDCFTAIVAALTGTSSPVRMTDVSDEEKTSYGLDSPKVVSKFYFSDGTTFECKIGNLNAFNGMYYYSCSADDAVYMVSSDVYDSLNVSIFDMIQYDDLPSILASNINKLTFKKGDKTLVYTYYPSGNSNDYTDAYNWYLSVNGGKEYPISTDFGSSISSAITGRTFSDCVAYNKTNDAAFGMDNPVTLVIDYKEVKTLNEGTDTESETTVPATYTIYFGGLDGSSNYYVRTTDSDLIYTIAYSDTFYDMFEDDGSEIRPEELIAPNAEFIDEIVYTAGGHTLDVTITHADVTTSYADKSGASMDYTAYSAIADKLAEMTIDSYTAYVEADASVGTDTLVSIEYTFNRGTEKNLKFEIVKYSNAYCQVKFNGRTDQLVTVEHANELIALIKNYFEA